MKKGKRPPTAEELALWDVVTATVAPLASTSVNSSEPIAEKPTPARQAQKAVTPSPKPSAAKPPPVLAPMDRRTRSRVARGSVAIDRRLDLHGLTQAAAERRLRKFLLDAQAEGAKVVLVITGKGRGGDDGAEHGVLKRLVPEWLAAPAMRAVVIGFEDAARHHGGGGALYVRLRRPI